MERQIISSRQNPYVKQICALSDKKRRAQSRLFRFDGVKLLEEALSKGVEIESVICSECCDARVSRTVERAISDGSLPESALVTVTQSVFDKLSEQSAPEGVITVARYLDSLHRAIEGLPTGRILIAESLRDAGNLGTVMRSCYALGIDALILTDDCADIYNPRTIRAAMGAVFKLNTFSVAAEKLPSLIGELRKAGRRVYATALGEDSVSIGDISLRGEDCFVIGNEGHGLSRETIDACTASVIIPMRHDAESLNAAAAATVCIWETVRA